MSLNYRNVQVCRILLRNWILIFLSWFGGKALKSRLYFYENCPPVKIISRCYRTLSSVQDLRSRLYNSTAKRYFLMPLNYWNVQPCMTLLRKWILIFLSWFPLQILNMVNTFKMHLFCIYFTFRWELVNQMYLKYIWIFTSYAACRGKISKYILNASENDLVYLFPI